LWALFAWALATAHQQCSPTFLSWDVFLRLEGEHPYQARILPFVMAKAIFLTGIPQTPDRLMAVFWLLDTLSAIVALEAMWRWVRICLGQRSWLVMGLWCWQVMVAFLLSTVHNWYYPYDLPGLAFISVGLWLVAARVNLGWVAAWTALAMLNRETAILLPLWLLVWRWPEPRARRHALGLLLMCVGIRVGISMAIGGLDRMAVVQLPADQQWRLLYNFWFLKGASSRWHTVNVFLAFGGLAPLLLLQTPLPADLRRLMWTLLPFVTGMALAANLSELRVFAEFFPLMAMAVGLKLDPGLTWRASTHTKA
jgi:hypothetical protein